VELEIGRIAIPYGSMARWSRHGRLALHAGMVPRGHLARPPTPRLQKRSELGEKMLVTRYLAKDLFNGKTVFVTGAAAVSISE